MLSSRFVSAKNKNSMDKMYIISWMIDGSTAKIMVIISDAQIVTMSDAWFLCPPSTNDWYASSIRRSTVTNTRQFFVCDCTHECMNEWMNEWVNRWFNFNTNCNGTYSLCDPVVRSCSNCKRIRCSTEYLCDVNTNRRRHRRHRRSRRCCMCFYVC